MAPPPTFASRQARVSPAARGAAVVVLASCALLTACGTAGPAATPTKTVTVRPSTATSPPPSSPAASAAAAGPPGCLASALQATLGVAQGTAGTLYQVVVLTNTSDSTCTLFGYPGVSFVSGVGGQQVGAAASRNSAVASTLVTLAPGGQANTLIGLHDAGAYNPSQCQPTSVDWLRIYPPGDYGSIYVQYQAQTCASTAEVTMSVTAIGAGAGSS